MAEFIVRRNSTFAFVAMRDVISLLRSIVIFPITEREKERERERERKRKSPVKHVNHAHKTPCAIKFAVHIYITRVNANFSRTFSFNRF